MRSDLRYAWRALWKNLTTTVGAVLAHRRRHAVNGRRRATVFAPGTRFPTFRPSRQRSIAKELTEPEYRALSKRANFRLTRVIPTNSAVSIVEAIPA